MNTKVNKLNFDVYSVLLFSFLTLGSSVNINASIRLANSSSNALIAKVATNTLPADKKQLLVPHKHNFTAQQSTKK